MDLPDPHRPGVRHRVDVLILAVHRARDLGLHTSDEYDLSGIRATIADRAQVFEHGAVYLDTATGEPGEFGWYAYTPLTTAQSIPGHHRP